MARRSLTQPAVERGRRAALGAMREVAESAGLVDHSIELLADARRRDTASPRDPDAMQDLARCHLRLAYLRDEGGDEEGRLGPEAMSDLRHAEAAWDRFLALNPSDPDPELAFRMEKAFREHNLDEPAKRLRAMEIALEHTEIPTAGRYENLARMYYAAGRLEECDAAAERAVALMPRLLRRWMRGQMKDLAPPR